MTIMALDPRNEASVVTLLERAAEWLSEAVHRGDPGDIAAFKAQIATAAEATRQLDLSKEIQLDAQEMVRRAEYALAKAIRRGQAEGTVTRAGEAGPGRGKTTVPSTAVSAPTDFAPDVELYDRPSQRKAGILSIADAADPEQFDAAIEKAKTEGNLSRANVSRKVKEITEPPITGRAAKAEILRDLAAQGYTSEQMQKPLDYSTSHQVRELAREHGIEIPADKVRGRARRFDHMRVLDNVTEAVEVAALSVRDIDPAQLDKEEALERLDSLTSSINALRQAVKKIKESFRE